jgi:hypothetical protein
MGEASHKFTPACSLDPALTLFTAAPRADGCGKDWCLKTVEGDRAHYQGRYPDRTTALRVAEMLATECGGWFLR